MMLPLLLSLLCVDAGAPPKKVKIIKLAPVDTGPTWMPYSDDGNYHLQMEKDRLRALPDLRRFPDYQCTSKMMGFLGKLRETVENKWYYAREYEAAARRNGWKEEAEYWSKENTRLHDWMEDLDKVKNSWEKLDFILRPSFCPEIEKIALAELRKMLGEKNYWLGKMPDLDYSFFERRDR